VGLYGNQKFCYLGEGSEPLAYVISENRGERGERGPNLVKGAFYRTVLEGAWY